jgi:hypothetical protein
MPGKAGDYVNQTNGYEIQTIMNFSLYAAFTMGRVI